jgi:drug/metabolite transporter (DMT)-like permease
VSVGYAFLFALGLVLGVAGVVFVILDVVRRTAPSRRLLVGAVLIVIAAVLLSVAPGLT